MDDNLIHSIGETEKQGAGIQLSMSARITIRNNSIYDLPRAGINVSEGTWGGHLIEGNDVFDTVLETGDHGSFNSWGRDRYWHPDRNVMDEFAKEHPQMVFRDATETTVIRNNRWRCDHGWDIDLDDGSSNYHIYNNLCLHGGLKLQRRLRSERWKTTLWSTTHFIRTSGLQTLKTFSVITSSRLPIAPFR